MEKFIRKNNNDDDNDGYDNFEKGGRGYIVI